jgi:thymidylate kinase
MSLIRLTTNDAHFFFATEWWSEGPLAATTVDGERPTAVSIGVGTVPLRTVPLVWTSTEEVESDTMCHIDAWGVDETVLTLADRRVPLVLLGSTPVDSVVPATAALALAALTACADLSLPDIRAFVTSLPPRIEGSLCRAATTPFVVVEGLDGVGKSTVSTALAAASPRRHRVKTPAPSWADIRARFDAQGEEARRPFYAVANYCAFADLPEDTTLLVLDRFVASTLAYGSATRRDSGSPPCWPVDLPRPQLTLILSVYDDEDRTARLTARDGPNGQPEEARLARDPAFRHSVQRNLETVSARVAPVAHIDAGLPLEQVVTAALDSLDTRARLTSSS